MHNLYGGRRLYQTNEDVFYLNFDLSQALNSMATQKYEKKRNCQLKKLIFNIKLLHLKFEKSLLTTKT